MLRHLPLQRQRRAQAKTAMCLLTRQPSTTLARLMRALATTGTVLTRAVVTTAGNRCSAVGFKRLGHHVLGQSHSGFVCCRHRSAS